MSAGYHRLGSKAQDIGYSAGTLPLLKPQHIVGKGPMDGDRAEELKAQFFDEYPDVKKAWDSFKQDHPVSHADAASNDLGFDNGRDHPSDVADFEPGPMIKTRDQAQQAGFTGNSCTCGSLMMVRNGTCEKCESCGSTTGCS